MRTNDKTMIVRENDLLPNGPKMNLELGGKITVYEFKIPEVINNILKKCEDQLPKEGFFFNTWDEDF